jgi:hypothetical protein
MEKIDIEIPGELITSSDSEISFDLLKNKTVIGFSGYAMSGKDTIGKLMVEKLSFKRISFGDMLKKDLDEHMRPQVFNDLKDKGIDIKMEDVNFLNPKDREIKELLRPYMIWFGEIMKTTNGIHHWTNRAISEIGEHKKVVITDVRRLNELDLFMYNKEQKKRRIENIFKAELPAEYLKPFVEDSDVNEDFNSLLIHINQFKLTDNDQRTVDTIRVANENWLFDHTVYVDSRIPDKEDYRQKYMNNHLLTLIEKFPKYFV